MKSTYPKKCVTKRCRGFVTRAAHSDKCPRCRWEWFKEKHPLAYSFGNLRRRAKQRGIAFSLTFDEYQRFAIGTDYASMKGKTSLSLSIDRIEGSCGYHAWNIAAISLSENSRKQWVDYFNGGMTPREKSSAEMREFRQMEREHSAKMERIAARIGKQFQPGSVQF